MSVTVQITFDCADPERLATFWCAALGYELESPPAEFDSWPDALQAWGVPQSEWNSRSAAVDPDRRGPRLFFQQVPEGKTAKNRLHLDLRAAPDLSGEAHFEALKRRADELVELGATIVRVTEATAMDSGFVVMQDPEGNEFCLD